MRTRTVQLAYPFLDAGRDPESLLAWLRGRVMAEFAQSDVSRIEAMVPVSASAEVRALHRAGFHREGRLRAADVDGGDVFVYGLVRGDEIDSPAMFSSVMDSVLPRTRLIGHVLFTDLDGRVLLLETSYKRDWELPGGVIEPGEPPWVGAKREVLEELGLEVSLGAPALVDWLPPYLGWSDAVEFLFDAGTLDADTPLTLAANEIRAAHWVSPDDVVQRVTPLSARRLALLLRREPGTIFTTNGYPLDA